jgi:simple sugar transport system permease protein
MKSFKKLFNKTETFLFLIIIVFSLLIFVLNRSFMLPENILGLLKSYSFTGIVAVGVFLVLLSGGVDLSFMAVATVAMYLMGSYMMSVLKGNIIVAFLICGAAGIILGAINGLLVYHFKIATLIVTLGTMNLFYGVMMFFSKSRDIYDLPEWFRNFTAINIPFGKDAQLSVFIIMWVLVLLITWFILKFTVLGRGIYALGGGGINRAKQAGFNVFGIQMFIYCYAGFLYGIASVISAGTIDQILPTSLVGKEMPVIAAVVVGGASLAGGSGSLLGVSLGVILLSLIRNGLTLMKVTSYMQGVVMGAIILISIIITNFRLRSLTRSTSKIDIEY